MESKKIKKQKQPYKKDPNAPKKGMTAFLHYLKDKCQKYKEEHPGIAHKEAIIQLGEIWRSISEEEKKPYQKKANADKE